MDLYELYFSPTGGTKKAADMLSDGLSAERVNVDLTDREFDPAGVSLSGNDTAVIAVPSYGGRVPAAAAERLSGIKANGARAVLVCVYGNRAYEDTLVELRDIAERAGFRVVAAAAAVAEHSIARRFAAGRPDESDRAVLSGFAERIKEKLDSGSDAAPAVPGNRPYKKSGGGGMVPKPSKDCTKCGVCAAKCPVGAIDPSDPSKTDSKKCISCMRCISVCPHSARKLNGAMLAAVTAMLKKVCSDRKECELFI